jgi:hypothetical protein|nr:MAG TPA: hypothetical protein [Siphoviridae sp. ctX8T1]
MGVIGGVSDLDFAGAGTGFSIDKILTPVVIVTFAFGGNTEGEGREGAGEGDHIIGDIERTFVFGAEGEDIVLVIIKIGGRIEGSEARGSISVKGLEFMLDGTTGGFRDESGVVIAEDIEGMAGKVGHRIISLI